MKKIISTSEAPAAVGPYSQAVRVGSTIYCAGQIPLDPKSGQIVSPDISEQTRRVLENIGAVLRSEGSLVVGQRVEVVLVGGDVVRENGADPDLLGRIGECLELAIHVVDRRDSALNRLAVACERGPVSRFRIERPDYRVPAGLQVLPEGKMVAVTLAERCVVVEIDEPWHHDLRRRVDQTRAPRVDGGSRDVDNSVSLDYDGRAEKDIVRVVHGDDDAVANDDALAQGALLNNIVY